MASGDIATANQISFAIRVHEPQPVLIVSGNYRPVASSHRRMRRAVMNPSDGNRPARPHLTFQEIDSPGGCEAGEQPKRAERKKLRLWVGRVSVSLPDLIV